MISFTCPGCETALKAPDGRAGMKAKCPRCKGPVSIPFWSTRPQTSEAGQRATTPSRGIHGSHTCDASNAKQPAAPVAPLPDPSRSEVGPEVRCRRNLEELALHMASEHALGDYEGRYSSSLISQVGGVIGSVLLICLVVGGAASHLKKHAWAHSWLE